jgi:hypothetical protein
LLGLVTPGSSIAQLGLVLMGFLPACATATALAFLMHELIPATE